MKDWLRQHRVSEIECVVPDMSGVARGKIVPSAKFLESLEVNGLRLPLTVFAQTVSGEWAQLARVFDPTEPDIYLRPDPDSLRIVPWYTEPTAQVIADCYMRDNTPVVLSPRFVLRRVIELYNERGWLCQVAPELEFYFVQQNTDPDYPLEPPLGRSGRPETGRQAYGIDAVNEFDPIVDDVYDYCEAQRIDVDTLIHESGAAQLEINFRHGTPLSMADQAFLFKRTVRQAALRHNIYATFMAKPIESEPGSAMHIHQSIVDCDNHQNLFANEDGTDTALFRAHIAGLQKYLPSAMSLLAPNVNSYRRLQRHWAAPINVHWGRENRTVGLRVPLSEAHERRIENRVAGADANPYLAIAASLACGYLGMTEGLTPSKPLRGSAYNKPYNLPRYLPDALERLHRCKPLRRILGDPFVDAFIQTKRTEHDAYQSVISSWEREHLLLNI